MADQRTDVAAAIIEITAEEAGVEAAGVTPASVSPTTSTSTPWGCSPSPRRSRSAWA